MATPHARDSLPVRLLHHGAVAVGALALTLALFLVLPLIQAFTNETKADTTSYRYEAANIPPPPPPPEPETDDEPEPEEKPPELVEEAPPLDLAQLELALGAGIGSGWMTGDFAVKLDRITAEGGGDDPLFSLAELDQTPRAIHQPGPALTPALRRKAPGKVFIVFVVDQRGRVENPIVQQSSDTVFERPALTAVKKWKFEPGKRNGKPVRFRMRVPITFPEG